MDFQEITQYERKLYNKGIKYVAGIDEVGRGPLAGPFVVSAVILNLEKIFSTDFQEHLNRLIYNKGKEAPNSKNTEIYGEEIIFNTEMTGKNKVMSNLSQSEEDVKINDVGYTEKNIQNIKLYTQIRDSKKVTPRRRDILSEFIKNEAISYSIEIFEAEEIDELGISELTQRAFFNAVKNLRVKPQYVLTDTFEVAKLTKQHQKNIVSGDNKSISIASASIVAKVFRDNIMLKMHEKYPSYGFDKHKGYGTSLHIKAIREFGPCEIHRKSFEPVKSFLKNLS
jgi:ribonuclease HII